MHEHADEIFYACWLACVNVTLICIWVVLQDDNRKLLVLDVTGSDCIFVNASRIVGTLLHRTMSCLISARVLMQQYQSLKG